MESVRIRKRYAWKFQYQGKQAVNTIQSRKVLLADDEVHIRAMLGTLVRSMGFEVVANAADGSEAVAQFELNKPDLVLLDINMPQKNGIQVLEEILKISPDTCVIMLTSLTDLETIENCLSLGAANYIRKDTPINEIKTLIQETWDSK